MQTRTNWDAGERDLAAASLDNALSVIARAQADGRDYTALAAVVGAMRQALTQELERIQAEERRLRDGQRLLTEKRLDEAQAQFRNTLDALLLAVRQAATEGLRTAETNQRLFEEAVRRGQSQLADHPAEAVALLHTAYDYWPYGPQIRGALVEALARAAEATLAADPRAAADYCQRALEFDPDNRRVKALVRYIGVKPTIEAVLEKARLDLNAAAEQPDGAGQFGEIITRLDEALSGAKEFPDLAAQLQTLRQAAQAGLAQWRTTEALYQQANLARGAGDWERLVELLREIVAVVGNGPLAGQTKPAEALKTAQAVAQALRELRPKLVRQVTRAQEAYADAPRTRELRPIVAALDEADQLGQEAQQRATAAEGYLPADLAQLRQQAADLRVTAQEISQALAEPQTSVGLTKLRALRKSGSTDATLEAFVAALEAQGRQAVPALKQQASNALDDGKLNEAVDLLRQAYELQPTDHALETHYAAVVRRKKLEDAVRLAQADAASKLTTNSKVDARNSLRGALDMLLGADLPPEVSAVLYQLFSLAEQDAGWGFGLPEKWSAAQALKDRLTALASGQTNWAFRRVSELATDWATLQRDIGLLGVVSSSAALNDLEPAYRAARTYVVTHPTEGRQAPRQLLTSGFSLPT